MPTRRQLATYPIGIILNGLVAEYRFDDGIGAGLRESRSGYHGTLGVGASDLPDWVAEGLDFVPGNSDVVINSTMPDGVILGALTVCIVANIDTGANFRAFVVKALTNAGTDNPLDFRTDNAATPKLTTVRGTTIIGNRYEYSGPTVTIGSWRMYTVTCPDGLVESVPTFYVGAAPTTGTKVFGTSTGLSVTGSGAAFRIGRRADGATQMDGKIAYILVYSRALSGAEVAQNYSALRRILTNRGIALP
jgi:hypothetical protein